jgi:hypothetical protein
LKSTLFTTGSTWIYLDHALPARIIDAACWLTHCICEASQDGLNHNKFHGSLMNESACWSTYLDEQVKRLRIVTRFANLCSEPLEPLFCSAVL